MAFLTTLCNLKDFPLVASARTGQPTQFSRSQLTPSRKLLACFQIAVSVSQAAGENADFATTSTDALHRHTAVSRGLGG